MSNRLPLFLLVLALAVGLTGCKGGSDAWDSGAGCEPEAGCGTGELPPVPVGLPRVLGLGLRNSPQQLEWMRESGVPWSYRYQYLTGGVNTGKGWAQSWGADFVEDYLLQSRAAGYVPVLTYYQAVASEPDAWNELQIPAKLQSADTMRAYFEDWKLLMQKCGAFGGLAIVHVEPDLWGYMQRENDDPRKVKVAVGSSGFEEAKGFADDAVGFAQALVALRDRYAPNVLLGYHASLWSTGKDLIANQQNPVKTGQRVAEWYSSLDVRFDLVFVGPSDRDAAWREAQGKAAGWWSQQDFERFGVFISQVVSGTGLRAVIWQIPVGNTLFRSLDNSWGHYQDNRVQVMLGDRGWLMRYADVGVIAMLFGAGADGCTMYDDSAGDGVTNPEPVNGNDREAAVADDDGGYLRSEAAAYYGDGGLALR